ncbi:MAG: enoyl-CoA hydratase/isomerase family protein [Halioglobus sp.]
MSEYENVVVSRDGPVAVVSLNRPESINAINSALLRDLGAAVTEVNNDESIRVAILTGTGRAFCAGADLTEDMEPGFDVEAQLNTEYKPVLMSITEAPQPWISAVNGAAAGIGSAFAMACDLTVMAEDAYIYQAFAAIGLIPDGGATWHLVHTLGRKRAYELIVTGEKLTAQRCLALGLCNRVVPADCLLDEAREWAQLLAAKAPLSLRHAKHVLNQATAASLADTISNEAKFQQLCTRSEDFAEGVAAFMDKRSPEWKGR